MPLASETQTHREEGMEPVDLLCSRNAHDKNVLVRRAQWEINQPPSLKRKRASLEGLLNENYQRLRQAEQVNA